MPSTKYNPPLLFDLSVDMRERDNIGPRNPEIVQRLVKEFQNRASGRR